MGGGDTSTEARNAKMNASSRKPFSEFRNQLAASDNEDPTDMFPQFNSAKKSTNLRSSFMQGQTSKRNEKLETVQSKDDDEVVVQI
jgi:hypothetical protein